MKKLLKPYALEDHLIPDLIKIARGNWESWYDVYTHSGTISSNPVLADPHRFASFLREYSVGRTVLKGKHDEFRRELQGSPEFEEAVRETTGQALDRLEGDLRPHFGSKEGKNRLISVLSKVAAFVRPERFVAWDQFAKKGLNVVRGHGASSPFGTYSEYLAAFDCAWEDQPGKQIKDCVARKGAYRAVEHEPRFQRRVLDVYLMECGGRWSRKARRK